MKRQLLIDIDSEREMAQVRIAVIRQQGVECKYDPLLDLGCIINAAIAMIGICDKEKLNDKLTLLQLCKSYLNAHYDDDGAYDIEKIAMFNKENENEGPEREIKT